MDRKKICFITSAPSSARAFLKEHFIALYPSFEITLIANFQGGDNVSDLKLDHIKNIQIERKPKPIKDLKALFLLYRFFRQERFFAVHSLTKKAILLTSIAAFCVRIPHRIQIFTGQVWATMTGLKRKIHILLDKFCVRLNNQLLVDGNSQMKYLIEHGIIREGDAQVLANGSICGVNIQRFSYNPEERILIRRELGISPEAVVYIFLGRLKTDKGINELLAAFNQLVDTKKDAILLLVGTDEEHCKQRLSRYNNLVEGENTIFYGSTPNPERLFHAGDIYCLPTYREGFGLAVLEASCIGLPVICSDTYGVMDAMVDNVTGLRCKTKDVDSLYDCMLKLHENPALRKDLGQNGAKRVRENFSSELVSSAWVEFYNSLR